MNFKSVLMLATTLGMAMAATGCGSGYIEGWREESTTTDQQRCERRDGWLWQGETCARYADADLSLVGDQQICGEIRDAEWIDNQCIRHTDLSASQCETFSDMTWEDKRCMTLAEFTCRLEDRVYEDFECVDPT